MNKYIEDDLNEIAACIKGFGFENKSFFITGAAGMIGKTIVNSLIRSNKKINVFVNDIDKDLIEKSFSSNVTFINLNNDLDNISKNHIDYIIHLASPTKSDFFITKPVETIETIYGLTKKVLDIAKCTGAQLLYVSSMESYGFVDSSRPMSENQLGFVSLDTPRSSYPEAKRLSELLCKSYFHEYKVDTRIARLAQTFGSTTDLSKDTRIFAYVANCIRNNRNIELSTDGKSFANYCYISDTIRALFYILKFGKPSETYNVSNKNCYISIKSMCKKVIKSFNSKILIKINCCSTSKYPVNTKLKLDTSKIENLGFKPIYNIEEMFKRMINF